MPTNEYNKDITPVKAAASTRAVAIGTEAPCAAKGPPGNCIDATITARKQNALSASKATSVDMGT